MAWQNRTDCKEAGRFCTSGKALLQKSAEWGL
jgi:hypothetical protein